jgi:hypothetical protein
VLVVVFGVAREEERLAAATLNVNVEWLGTPWRGKLIEDAVRRFSRS